MTLMASHTEVIIWFSPKVLFLHFLGAAIRTEEVLENLLCAVGGVMCAVALMELLPEARRQHRPYASAVGLLVRSLAMLLTIRLGA